MYACESWTLTAGLEKRTEAFEMRCYRRLLNISYKYHVTNEEVRSKIQAAIGEYDELLTLVNRRKLRWFGHVSRSSGLAAKTILQGTVIGKRTRNVTLCNKCPRRPLIMTLIPGCDLEHSQGTRILHRT